MKFLSSVLLLLVFVCNCRAQKVLGGIYKECYTCDTINHNLEGDWVNVNDSNSYIKFHHENTEVRLYKDKLNLYDITHYSDWLVDSTGYNTYSIRLFYESAHSPVWEKTYMPINSLNKDTLRIGGGQDILTFVRKRK